MPITDQRMEEIVQEFISRPGHEKVRAVTYELLVHGLGASSVEIDFEKPVPEVRGRLDALLGRTVFEFKSNLAVEIKDAESQLTRYLADRENETGEHFVGIATDGAKFISYEVREEGLFMLADYEPSISDPRGLLDWLGAVVILEIDLEPEPDVVERELGKNSLVYRIASGRLSQIWSETKTNPEVRVKRQLWAALLQQVYGSSMDEDELFIQHTYLKTVAKAMAMLVLGAEIPEPVDLLNGRPLRDIDIHGAVESDFFDWIIEVEAGKDFVRRIGEQVRRFRIEALESDVLKGLYESLIDPPTRHDLGEYYTPDWLAWRTCQEVITQPLEQRVLDPACGSGTFLFHAVRRLLDASDAEGISNKAALANCVGKVLGIDIHPVAVIIARVNYILAIGRERLQGDRDMISIPVYMGDAVQWNTEGFLVDREVLIQVPEGPVLHFPAALARDPLMFDDVVGTMLQLSEPGQQPPSVALTSWISNNYPELGDWEKETLSGTYDALCQLQQEGRNHIWGFVARNLSRPVWLSSEDQKVDVLVGNPPWLSYRFMSDSMQERFRNESTRLGLWVGGNVATHQDLSAYFFVRCVELYLNEMGTIAFVMPFAALSRKQFQGFRTGLYGRKQGKKVENVRAVLRVTKVWTFDERVQPLFPVPSCLIVGRKVGSDDSPSWPDTYLTFAGTLPARDASAQEAEDALTWEETERLTAIEGVTTSSYRDRFRQGATIVPRVLSVVDRVQQGMLGGNQNAPLVQSRRAPQEKEPW
ncbi:MAG: N-6 DNA methylase, partial [Chloroflexi bacterium]|nr:N-6 DNA methylase [Chloroflexota bacterium]